MDTPPPMSPATIPPAPTTIKVVQGDEPPTAFTLPAALFGSDRVGSNQNEAPRRETQNESSLSTIDQSNSTLQTSSHVDVDPSIHYQLSELVDELVRFLPLNTITQMNSESVPLLNSVNTTHNIPLQFEEGTHHLSQVKTAGDCSLENAMAQLQHHPKR